MRPLKILRWFVLILIVTIFSLGFYVLYPLPQRDQPSTLPPDSYAVPIQARFETQGHNQCAAFSTAFVLRNTGVEFTGSKVYEQIPFKVPVSGYVLPKGVLTYLKDQGKAANIYKGDLNTLKFRLAEQDKPIIVLVGNSFFWQHYMTIVGFDSAKQELYFVDSNMQKDENGTLPGNRTMTEDYFLKWWSNGLPIFNHVFITAA